MAVEATWLPARLRWQAKVRPWQRRGIVVAGVGPLRWLQVGVEGNEMLLQARAVSSSKETVPAEVLLHGNEILALKDGSADTQALALDPFGAGVELLRREWMLSLFLFGPILGVFLVNLIFGMPSFLWWTALGVLCFSLAIMGSLLQRDLRAMRAWLQSRKKLWQNKA